MNRLITAARQRVRTRLLRVATFGALASFAALFAGIWVPAWRWQLITTAIVAAVLGVGALLPLGSLRDPRVTAELEQRARELANIDEEQQP
jgi:hypothetical protein